MYISKTKTYSQLSLSELKEDLRIYDSSFDAELTRLIKSAVAYTEKQIQSDIVTTVNNLEDYDFNGSSFKINEPNISVTSIQVTNDVYSTPFSYNLSGDSYVIEKYNQYTLINFKNSVNAERINITYTSGLSSIPEDLKRAIFIMVGWLFDQDKNGVISSGVQETKTFQRLITHYINIIE